jgi:hypothetical protein
MDLLDGVPRSVSSRCGECWDGCCCWTVVVAVVVASTAAAEAAVMSSTRCCTSWATSIKSCSVGGEDRLESGVPTQ